MGMRTLASMTNNPDQPRRNIQPGNTACDIVAFLFNRDRHRKPHPVSAVNRCGIHVHDVGPNCPAQLEGKRLVGIEAVNLGRLCEKRFHNGGSDSASTRTLCHSLTLAVARSAAVSLSATRPIFRS